MRFLVNLWWLLVAHALTDYAWQSEMMAALKDPYGFHLGHYKKRGPWWWSMLAHALINGGGVALVTRSVGLGVAETLVHFLTDWWKCHVCSCSSDESLTQATRIDQGIHLASKCLWAMLA